jgi:hypothetical protein
MREKKARIDLLKKKINERRELIREFTELVVSSSENMKDFKKNTVAKNSFILSPFNNTKPISSREILDYAKTISFTLQGPPDDDINKNWSHFGLPMPTDEILRSSYLHFTSRNDGKVN